MSDTVAARFGVREVRSEVDPALQGHVFYVNGQRVSSFPLLMERQQQVLMQVSRINWSASLSDEPVCTWLDIKQIGVTAHRVM